MYGYAQFRGHITRREEKGLFGIPFKRLLGCGIGAGATLTLTRIVFPNLGVVAGIASFILLLFLTAPFQGLARWRRLIYAARWRLIQAAAQAPTSLAGSLGALFDLPTDALVLNGSRIFTVETDVLAHTTLPDWATFSQPSAVDGLTFVRTPGLASMDESKKG